MNCDFTTDELDVGPADLNGDGVVNVADDHNRDGVVDNADKEQDPMVALMEETAKGEFDKGASFLQARSKAIEVARDKGLSLQQATRVAQTGSADALGAEVADGTLKELEKGIVLFAPPKEMRLGDTELVDAVILPKLSETLRRESRKEGENRSATIEVGDNMQAALEGVHFDYLPQGAVNQRWAGPTDSTEWSWQISPNDSGPELLTLKITALLNIEGTQTANNIASLTREVEVTRPWWQRLSGIIGASWWQWAWAVLLVPLAGWVYKRWHKRRCQKKVLPYIIDRVGGEHVPLQQVLQEDYVRRNCSQAELEQIKQIISSPEFIKAARERLKESFRSEEFKL